MALNCESSETSIVGYNATPTFQKLGLNMPMVLQIRSGHVLGRNGPYCYVGLKGEPEWICIQLDRQRKAFMRGSYY